ncbi:HAD-like domain-containing protein [Staphylotrichum tortipilum]|uniref:Mitochondrial import inner membrane translocase subunit TIM50 n=1 Tax=Staphylotrichum tortipilum TaxID=2831512 RepID=A0AAN6MJ51_9PEZI|nr:HAD-like domain-containing protein [Staphylotrichum longicolle]
MDNLRLNSSSQANPLQQNTAITNHNPVRHRDAITAPSAASGGVPEPTPAYLQQSSFPPFPLPSPQPILVVIDLNGTLLHRPRPSSPTHFIERPGASSFLRHCVAHHHVVVWSSAQAPNVERMCAQLLPPDILSRVVAVWGRDRFGLTTADYRRRTQCYKRLTRLWADPGVALSHPIPACAWSQANTVLIDDSAEKARSEPYNAITVPEFGGGARGNSAVEPEDEVLSRVEAYLDTLTWQMDVSAYIRRNPFTMETEEETASPMAQEEEGEAE